MRNRLRREEGAAAVEFALIVGVLSLLVFGMLEYGLFFLQAQTLRAGAREGARTAAVGGELNGPDNNAVGAAVNSGSANAISATSNAITMAPAGGCDGNNTLGTEVQVTIDTGSGGTYPSGLSSATIQAFQIDVPFLPHLNVHPTVVGAFRCEK